jgi:ADP-dependent NAD(P)H-hydrate dehydratase / NAD(P)H-hydrate epimerase
MEELLSPTEMGLADKLAGNEAALMEAAGRAVARAVRQRFRPCPVLVLAGPGKNGGDGHVAARYLAQAGWPVRVAAPEEVAGGGVDPARFGLAIDAVFGAGLSRDVGGPAEAALRDVERSRKPIVAIDVPSGVDGASGAVRGYAAQAQLTVTFFRRKPGHLLFPGRGLCGETLLADIGLPASVLQSVAPKTWRNGPWLWLLPGAHGGDHKYTRGVVCVASGAMAGAARLAAMAARRAGAGLAILVPEQAQAVPEAGIIVDADPKPGDPRRRVWVCGPGLGGARAAVLLPQLFAARRIVVGDADALTAHAGNPELLGGCAVITPHAGEFARLFGSPEPDRLAAARAAAARIGTVVVLKGADSVIAAPDGRAAINDNAPPALATGGTGDVLAGTIGALLARGMAAFEAACAAVWLNGEAARAIGPGLIAEDLPAAIGHAVHVDAAS